MRVAAASCCRWVGLPLLLLLIAAPVLLQLIAPVWWRAGTWSGPGVERGDREALKDHAAPTLRDRAGVCAQAQSSQLHGPLSNEQAAELISLASSAPSSSCPLYHRRASTESPYASWQPDGVSIPAKWILQNRQQQQQEHHPDFDPLLYSPDETNHIAQLLYDHQNPPDCSQVRFLVLTREWHSGLGSNIHVKAWMLLVAIMSNRILVDSANIDWNMTNPLNCASQDWACYFAPVSKCALGKDWDESKTPEFAAEDLTRGRTATSTRKYVRTIAHPQPLNGALLMGQSVRIEGFGGGAEFDGKPNSWWMTHATNYLIRPNKRTLGVACWYWSCMPHRLLPSTSQEQQPTASIFVRSGDKWKEANLRTAQEHFDALERFVQSNPDLRPSTVYFGTDDALVLSDVVRQYSNTYNLTWIGFHRDVKGLSFEETITRGHSPKIELQVLVSLADLYISSLADIFVGTLSSNWCRLADELRKAHGKAGLPYLTPEGEALVAGV
jgi:hypothetical protein